MKVTAEQLALIMPAAKKKVAIYVDPINQTIIDAELNTRLRLAMFLAQIAHESGQLVYSLELASGKAYEGRKDLGNTQPGDGVRYKGRGLIQITGRANYTKMADALGVDCVNNPKLIEEPLWATRSAGWYWNDRKLNQYCDKSDFVTLTKRINGGTNGLEDRQQFFIKALAALPA